MPRNPKPTALLKLEKGTLYGAQRARAAAEPQGVREVKPRCPKRFSPEERRAWREIASILKNYGLFVAANVFLIELLATAWVQYLDISRRVAAGSAVDTDAKGRTTYNHLFLAQRKLAKEIEQLTQSLGLSSLALAKIGSLAVAKRREKEAYFDD